MAYVRFFYDLSAGEEKLGRIVIDGCLSESPNVRKRKYLFSYRLQIDGKKHVTYSQWGRFGKISGKIVDGLEVIQKLKSYGRPIDDKVVIEGSGFAK